MSIGKALFQDFEKYIEWYKSDKGIKFFSIENLWSDQLYHLQGKIPGIDISNLFHDAASISEAAKYNNEPEYIKNLSKIVSYISKYSTEKTALSFDLIYETDFDIDIICFGKHKFLVPSKFLQKQYLKDYSDFSLLEIKETAIDKSTALISSTSPLLNQSLSSVKQTVSNQNSLLKEVETERMNINNSNHSALAELQKEIDEKMAELENKKAVLLQELEKRKAEIEAEKIKVEQNLFILESEIYSIRCFLGEVVDFIQIKSGKAAPTNAPITLFQKIRFLDEELGKHISLYNVDFSDAELFEEVLATREDILDLFCPNDKCVSLVRVSKSNKRYSFSDSIVGTILDEYEVYHGKKIGILIRNGENVYCGWTDEERINISEDMFYSPSQKVLQEEDSNVKVSSKEEVVSRYFIFSILQGTLENTNLLSLPKDISVNFACPSKYIIYSAADTWLCDNRFGSFKDIVEKANSIITVGDKILSFDFVSDGIYQHGGWGSATYNRDHNCSRRTHDTYLYPRQIYTIRTIEQTEYGPDYYVSLKKPSNDYVYRNGNYRHRIRDAYALFRINKSEFVNLTYLNSVWIEYVITTRNLGFVTFADADKNNFANMISFLNTILQYIREREEKEKELIEKFYPQIDNVIEWPVKLSEWKLNKHVRNVTEHQAKRFAKHLEETI